MLLKESIKDRTKMFQIVHPYEALWSQIVDFCNKSIHSDIIFFLFLLLSNQTIVYSWERLHNFGAVDFTEFPMKEGLFSLRQYIFFWGSV